MDNIKEPKISVKHFFGPPLSPPVYPKPRYFSWRLPKVTAQPANRAHHVLIGGAKVKVGLGGDNPNHKEVNKEDMEGSWSRHQDLFFPRRLLCSSCSHFGQTERELDQLGRKPTIGGQLASYLSYDCHLLQKSHFYSTFYGGCVRGQL